MNHAIRILLSAFMLLAANAELPPELIQQLRDQCLEVVEVADESPKKARSPHEEVASTERRLEMFDPLVLIDYWGDIPRLREQAVSSFGDEFVRDLESTYGIARAQLAGMRFNEMVMREEGEDYIDALMRYRDQTGDKTVESEADMWKHYAAGRKEQLEKIGILQEYAKEQEKAQQLNREAEQKRLREQKLQELTRGIIYGAGILLLLYPAYKLLHVIITYRNGKHIPSVACIILLMIAMLHMPHGYYTFLRLSVFTWGASEAFRAKVQTTRVATVGIALLYNPIIEVQLAKGEWLIINLLTALGILSAIAYSIYQHRKRENPNTPA